LTLASSAQASGAASAAKWLQQQQQSNGSWVGASSGTDVLATTSAVLEALVLTGQAPSGANIQNALTFLKAAKPTTATGLARRVIGDVSGGQKASSSDLQALLTLQTEGGGFAPVSGHQATEQDTALAVIALGSSQNDNVGAAQKALGYLISKQRKDGGWGYIGEVNDSSPYLTGMVMLAFGSYRHLFNLRDPLNKAVTYLTGKQATEGSWGMGRDKNLNTALAVIGLMSSGQILVKEISNASNYLLKQQAADGSFDNGDTFATAYVLRALDSQKPDLMVRASEIVTTPSRLLLGDELQVQVKVHNTGTSEAKAVVVRMYSGDPKSGGKQIDEQTIASIAGGGSANITLRWSKAGPIGDYYLHIVADPDNKISELDERNNTAILGIKTLPPIDLVVTTKDILLKPAFPSPNKPVEITATIHNAGGVDVKQVEVAFYDGDPKSGGKQIGTTQTIALIQAGKSDTATVKTPDLPQGNYSVFVVADPAQKISDSDRLNNTAKLDYQVSPRIDLMVMSQGILMSAQEVTEGTKVEIQIGVYNNEGTTAKDAVVRLYKGDPNSGGTPIGKDEIITIQGYAGIYTAPIIFDTTNQPGSFQLYAVVDPDNKFPDINRMNNIAIRTLKVLGLPDLSIIDSEVTFNTTSPTEITTLTVYANIRNLGHASNPSGGQLHLYDKDPSLPNSTSISSTTIAVIAPNAASRPGLSVSMRGRTGLQRFWMVIDPQNAIPDRNRNNNIATNNVIVQAYHLPDLTISSNEFTIIPSNPQSGTQITLQAIVSNILGTPATNAVVRFFNGSTTTADRIGEVTLPLIAAYGQATASIQWTVPNSLAETTLHVWVDPDNKISEYSTSNNQASLFVRFALGQSAAPRNFTVTAQGTDTLLFQWQAGTTAAAAGIRGYRIFCNGGLLNPPSLITGLTADASSSSSATYDHTKAVDNSTSTYWQPLNAGEQWIEFTMSQAEQVAGAIILFSGSYADRKFQLQAWVNNQWQKVQDFAGGQLYEHFFDAITSNRWRLYFDSSMTSTLRARVLEIRFYRSELFTGTTHTRKQAPPGPHECYAVGVTSPLLMTPPSNTDTARLGDITPPGVPTNVQVLNNPTQFANQVSWSAPTDADLDGHRVYNNIGIDVAHWARGATVYALGSTNPYLLLDGLTSSNTSVTVPNDIVVKLSKTYSVSIIRIYLATSGNYRYVLESSVDGTNFTQIAERNTEDYRGQQEHILAQPLQIRYLRIVTKAPTGSSFSIAEVEVISTDMVLLTGHAMTNYNQSIYPSPGASFWTSYWSGWRVTYTQTVTTPRQFIMHDVRLSPLDVLTITDVDTNQVLAQISGNHDTWQSGWFRAKVYRLEYIPVRGDGGFRIPVILTQDVNRTPAYSHANIYLNGTYRYAVSAVDLMGNESNLSTQATLALNDTTPPNAPTNLKATGSNKQVALTWTGISVPRDFKGYFVYRDGKKIAELTTTSYTDSEVVNGTTYSYEVSAADVNGNESNKAGPIKATPTALDLTLSPSGVFADIFISPANPSIYEKALIVVMVRNIGTQDSPSGVEIDLYDGDPKASGTKIGTITLNKEVLAGLGVVGSYEWNLAQVKPGQRKLFAVIDPSNKVPEINKNNNTSSIDINIHGDYYLDTSINRIDSDKFPQIDVYMRVRDANGGGIFGLDERNFKVFEDGTRELPIKVKALSEPQKTIPKADIVFVIDTSGSMGDEWLTVCSVIDDITDLLLASRIDAKITIYGLRAQKQCGVIMNTVVWRGQDKAAHEEDWGPGATWAALKHPWRTDAARIVIPISDEGAYAGDSWTAEDTESVNEAIKAAQDVRPPVIYFPFWGNELNPGNIIVTEMQRMATETGGEAFAFRNALQVVQAIVQGVQRSISDYMVTYDTHNPAHDGTLRTVVVETEYNISSGKTEGTYRAPLSNLPDLLFEGPLVTIPDPLVPAQVGVIEAIVRNSGGKEATDIEVIFAYGDPSQGGLTFAVAKVAKLIPGQSQKVTANWRALPGAGKLVVIVDPDDKIPESNEKNNRVEKALAFPGERGIDLAVNSFGISVTPFPAVMGQKVQLEAMIYNIGQLDAAQVLVSFFRGDPLQGGETIGSTTLPLVAKSQSVKASIAHILDKVGDLDLYVVIDPHNAIEESSKTNNTANRLFTIDKRDLVLSVTTDKTNYPAKSDVEITVKLRNQTFGAWSGRGEVHIVDKNNHVVDKVDDFAIKDLPPFGPHNWTYRVPVSWTVPSGGAKNIFLAAKVDFTKAMQEVGQQGQSLDLDKIYVTLHDPVNHKYQTIPYRLRQVSGFDPQSKAEIDFLFFFKEPIAEGTHLPIYIFFDIVGGSSPKPPSTLPFPDTGFQISYVEENGQIYLLERQLDGTMSSEISVHDLRAASGVAYSRSIGLGDFTNNGITDLIAVSGIDRKVYLYPGDPSAPTRFDIANAKEVATLASSSIYPISGLVGDINNDGNLDFVFGHATLVYILLGKGDGTFQSRTVTIPSSRQMRGATLVDIDGDGHLDLVFAVNTSGTIYLMKNDGKGILGAPQVMHTNSTTDSYGFAVGDFNGDKHLDLLINSSSTGNVLLFAGDGSGKWPTEGIPVPSLKTNNHNAWAIADWNYDGKLDILATTYTTQTILLFEGKGDGTFAAPVQLNTAKASFLGLNVSHPSTQATAAVGKANTPVTQTWTFKWNTDTTHADNYNVRVELFEDDGVVASESAAFTIDPDIKAKAELTTDKLAYPANSPVSFVSRIFNESLNAVYDSLKGSIVIKNAQDKQISVLSFTVENLSIGSFRDHTSAWNTAVSPPGKYTAHLSIEYKGKEITQASTSFEILSGKDSGIALLGTLQVNPGLAQIGDTVNINFEVTNIGNETLTDHDLKVRIFSDDDRQEKGSIPEKVTLPVQRSATFNKPYDTSSLAEGDYTLLLTTNIGTVEISLAAATLKLSKTVVRPPLTIKITAPTDGAILTSPVVAVSGDVADGDASVSVNGIPAQVAGSSAQASSFSINRINLSECVSTITASATRGNDTATDKISVEVPHRSIVLTSSHELKSSIASPGGVAVSQNNTVLISDPNNGTIVRLSLDANQKVIKEEQAAADLIDPHAIIEDQDGNIYVAESSANRVSRIDKNNKKQTWMAETDGLIQPGAFALDDKGGIFVASTGNGKIFHIDKSQQIELYSDAVQQPVGLAFDPKSAVLYALDRADGNLYRIAQKADPPKSVAAAMPSQAAGLAMIGNWLILSDKTDNAIYTADLNTANIKIVAGLFKGASAIAAMPNNSFVIATDGNGPIFGKLNLLLCRPEEEPEKEIVPEPVAEPVAEPAEEPIAEPVVDAADEPTPDLAPDLHYEASVQEHTQPADLDIGGEKSFIEQPPELPEPPPGCGCSTNTKPIAPIALALLTLLVLLSIRRKYRQHNP
jgi:subtilase family serine protease